MLIKGLDIALQVSTYLIIIYTLFAINVTFVVVVIFSSEVHFSLPSIWIVKNVIVATTMQLVSSRMIVLDE